MADIQEVRRTNAEFKQQLMRKPNVVGVGVGYKERGGRRTSELCVVAMVRIKVPRAGLLPEDMVPERVAGVVTDVVQVGHLVALQARTDRWRPAPGGVSIGHFQVTAGTLGTAVRDANTGERLILSNNHVLANSNGAEVGDPILQPGAVDGGTVNSDTIADLLRFVPIQFNQAPPSCGIASGVVAVGNFLAKLVGSKHRLRAIYENPQAVNLVDAAVARPRDPNDVLQEILDVGEVSGTLEAQLGMAVRKSGRTTAFTTGQITVLDASVTVSYGDNRTAQFDGQLVTGPMSQGGDSGSLLVAADSLRAVGLLFAGSSQTTIFNPIQAVLQQLQIEL